MQEITVTVKEGASTPEREYPYYAIENDSRRVVIVTGSVHGMYLEKVHPAPIGQRDTN